MSETNCFNIGYCEMQLMAKQAMGMIPLPFAIPIKLLNFKYEEDGSLIFVHVPTKVSILTYHFHYLHFQVHVFFPTIFLLCSGIVSFPFHLPIYLHLTSLLNRFYCDIFYCEKIILLFKEEIRLTWWTKYTWVSLS